MVVPAFGEDLEDLEAYRPQRCGDVTLAAQLLDAEGPLHHPFLIVKRDFGVTKTRYRGIGKNLNHLHVLFASANWLMRARAVASPGDGIAAACPKLPRRPRDGPAGAGSGPVHAPERRPAAAHPADGLLIQRFPNQPRRISRYTTSGDLALQPRGQSG